MRKKMSFFTFKLLLLCALFFWSACSNDSAENPTAPGGDPADGLAVGTPASQNIDEALLASAYQQARQQNGLRSLLVARNGVLVAEEYFGGYNRNRLNHVRSVTKSVVATLIGIAIREGFLQNTNQTLSEFLQPYSENRDGTKGQIAIEHLLTMTSGFSWNETNGNEYGSWITSGDQIDYVIDKPLVAAPGQQFTYNSGTSHLLSAILTQATRMSTKAFAEKYLFAPLGITDVAWDQVSDGIYNGGAGLQLTARDMVKFGFLYLQNGVSGGEQIVPAEWITRAWQQKQTLGFAYGPLKSVHYGYLWWMEKGGAHDAFFAWGYGGQFVFCVPDLNLVVTTTSQWQLSAADASAQERANMDLIVNKVLPAVR